MIEKPLLSMAKVEGLDVIETYVFLNVHEPSPGNVLHFHSLKLLILFCLTFSMSTTPGMAGNIKLSYINSMLLSFIFVFPMFLR
jgi:ribulose-5-phosphate 4-epimerase/fuculose-1-phosphate aldolase